MKNMKNKSDTAAKPFFKKKKNGGHGTSFIVVSAIISAVLIAVIAIAVIIGINSNKTLDYVNSDLSKYVYISEEYYKNPTLSVALLEKEEGDLQKEINKLLVQNKDKNAEYEGAAVHKPGYQLKLGDEANIWYSVYVIEDGKRRDLGISNFGESTPNKIELGSGSFVKGEDGPYVIGFEDALIGMTLQDFDFAKYKYTSGTVVAADIIYVSYTSLRGSESSTVGYKRIDLADSTLDSDYGEGFSKFFQGKTIGEKLEDSLVVRIPGDETDTVYSDIKIEYVTRCERNAIQIEAKFPADFKTAEYRGLEVIFDVFVSSAILYKTPEWNDSFITETLKESADSLAEYEGATLTEKYEKKLEAEIEENIKETNKLLIEEALWNSFVEHAEVKKLPNAEVEARFSVYYNEMMTSYESYQSYYKLDDFACMYFELSESSDWRAYLTAVSESEVAEKLIFYYILQKENLIPSEEEYNRLYNENVEDRVEYYKEYYYKEELEACETEAERTELSASIRDDVLKYFGDEYFSDNVYYQFAMEKLVASVTVS